jgi:hypothetical protein
VVGDDGTLGDDQFDAIVDIAPDGAWTRRDASGGTSRRATDR